MTKPDLAVTVLIVLGIQGWNAHAIGKRLRRELSPLRRRDMTLACVDNPAALAERFSKDVWRLLAPVLLVYLAGFILSWALPFLAVLDFPVWGLLAFILAYVILLLSAPFGWGVMAWVCGSACRRNADPPAWMEWAAALGFIPSCGLFGGYLLAMLTLSATIKAHALLVLFCFAWGSSGSASSSPRFGCSQRWPISDWWTATPIANDRRTGNFCHRRRGIRE